MANILKTEKKVAVIPMLAEGSSIRPIERITGANGNTIMSLGLRVGMACKKIIKEYIERLQLTIQHLHNCAAIHRESVRVHEIFQGKTVWQGDVEVFDLTGHPKAKRCYGRSYGEPEEFITILVLPPVDSAQSAVKVGVACQVKNSKRK